jgi:hypothetical protein
MNIGDVVFVKTSINSFSDEESVVVTAANKAFLENLVTIGRAVALGGAAKVYRALMTQSGENAPSVVVLENTIGNIVWSYINEGIYHGTLVGAFPEEKTFAMINSFFYGEGTVRFYGITRVSDNVVEVESANTNFVLRNDHLSNTPIEILVYP